MELKVVETDPGVRGDTATAVRNPRNWKPARWCGYRLFINEGEILRIEYPHRRVPVAAARADDTSPAPAPREQRESPGHCDSSILDAEGQGVGESIRAQRDRDQPVKSQCDTRAIGHSVLERGQQVLIQWWLILAACTAPASGRE